MEGVGEKALNPEGNITSSNVCYSSFTAIRRTTNKAIKKSDHLCLNCRCIHL